ASYALFAAILGLSFFLVTAIYRRLVVEKLRLKLMESATENKLAHLAQLAASLAHEIKQPLAAINVWLWTLQKGVKEGTNEHTGATVIRKEINRLDQIVKNFLGLTTPVAPKLVPIKAAPFLQEIVQLLSPQLENQGIDLHLEDSRVDVGF